MNNVIEVPAEVFDRIEIEMIRAGLGHRLDTGAIDMTDISITRGEHVGLTKPAKRSRDKQALRG